MTGSLIAEPRGQRRKLTLARPPSPPGGRPRFKKAVGGLCRHGLEPLGGRRSAQRRRIASIAQATVDASPANCRPQENPFDWGHNSLPSVDAKRPTIQPEARFPQPRLLITAGGFDFAQGAQQAPGGLSGPPWFPPVCASEAAVRASRGFLSRLKLAQAARLFLDDGIAVFAAPW
jgi:hypothetical protein